MAIMEEIISKDFICTNCGHRRKLGVFKSYRETFNKKIKTYCDNGCGGFYVLEPPILTNNKDFL